MPFFTLNTVQKYTIKHPLIIYKMCSNCYKCLFIDASQSLVRHTAGESYNLFLTISATSLHNCGIKLLEIVFLEGSAYVVFNNLTNFLNYLFSTIENGWYSFTIIPIPNGRQFLFSLKSWDTYEIGHFCLSFLIFGAIARTYWILWIVNWIVELLRLVSAL